MKKFVAKQTDARWLKFSSELKRATNSPHDAEAIHDLRVSIRRLVQCFRSFAEFYDKPDIKKVRKPLKKLMAHCGAVRNYDITIELLNEAGLAGDRATALLQQRRSEEEAELVKTLKRFRKRKLTWGHKPSAPSGDRWLGNDPPQVNATRVLPQMFAELVAAGRQAAQPGAAYDRIHRFRIQAKRFRYTLELFQTFYGQNVEHGLDELKQLQDKLGALNDCVTALDLLKRRPRAKAAVSNLLKERETGFREHWKARFGPQAVKDWKTRLAAPEAASDNAAH